MNDNPTYGEQSEPALAVIKKLEQCGHRLDFHVRKDWKPDYGYSHGIIDLVWLKTVKCPLPGGRARYEDLPVVAFEIESSWQSPGLAEAEMETTDWRPTKDLIADTNDLIDSKAPLVVLVLCKGPNDTQHAIDYTKKAAEKFIRDQWYGLYLVSVWDEEDVETLCSGYHIKS